MNDGLSTHVVQALQAELVRRRRAEEARARHLKARRSFVEFCTEALEPYQQVPARHHRLLCDKLEEVCSGTLDRLMVLMPPGSAKSTYVSQLFPPYWFIHHPLSAVIAASNTSDLAMRFGRKVRNLVNREQSLLGYTLSRDAMAAGKWETSGGGEYYAAGINGGDGTTITGRRADLVIIDDPTRGRQEASNENTQLKIIDWYRAELYPRLKPKGRIVVVMTRWDMRDLGGYLEDEMEAGGDQWHIIRLPAIAEDPALSTEDYPIEPDALDRAPGEALWPEWESLEDLERKRIAVGERDWSALYQQRPNPAKGLLFDVEKIVIRSAAPECPNLVRAWDLAATAQTGTNDPDWTVGLLLGRTAEGHFVILDVKRMRGGPSEIENFIVRTAHEDDRKVRIRLPEDPGQAGKAQTSYLGTKLAGFNFISERETGDKVTRATPVISQCNVGNLSMVEAKWNRVLTTELRDFDQGRHDDIVDALSGAFNQLFTRAPMRISDRALVNSIGPRRMMS